HFDRYFSAQRSRRLRRAARYEPIPHRMNAVISGIMAKSVLTVVASTSIQRVAELMSERRVSSAFITNKGALRGIVTDRDLRVRCVAKALSVLEPVSAIMTSGPKTLSAQSTIFDATLAMTQLGVHHIPVIDQDCLVGVVTTSDLMLAKQDDPVYLVTHIGRQDSVEAIAAIVTHLPSLMVAWSSSGLKSLHVSRLLTAISDAIVVRLLQLAEVRYGPAPGPYCWLGFGSQGRGEQLLGADQDNGMVIDDGVPLTERDWYRDVANYVCDGLALVGYRYCPGNIMAKNTEWRMSLRRWQETVAKWTRTPTEDAVMRVTIFFDIRGIYGDLSLAERLQQTMRRETQGNTIFIAALAANALGATPPLGVFRRFIVEHNGEHKESVNIKKRGILPITDIARLHALANGLPEVNTDERITALVKNGVLQIKNARNLSDALHTLQQARIDEQCRLIEVGEAPGNYINPRTLGTMGKEQLRDAFTIIKEAQSVIKLRYRSGLD
ncbi:MAG: putative nucleotidyltransferase substrate binding domain-containing protein, partial [Halieaceae bacterium]|nr:putative nucleotidyltransferase substrate binding domain-containing protein [Halieaceae bacterium]